MPENREIPDSRATPAETAAGCRRSVPDRRSPSMRTIRHALRGGRRHKVRRQDHGPHGHYVDKYEPGLMVSTLFVLLLSCTDALLTLTLLQKGAIEANPVMAMLLNINVHWFAIGKMALTGTCLVFLVTHTHYRLFGVLKIEYVLHFFVPVYFALIAYEMFLLYMIGR